MWKAFTELQSLGVVKDPLPRMVAAQSSGCAPVVKAFQNLSKTTEFFKDSYSIALGLNVPGPLGGHWILDILYESKGIALDVSEKSLKSLTDEFNQITLMDSGPEAGVVWGAYKVLKEIGWILREESVVLFATGIERCKL
jgi:threonine synthase